MDDVQDPGSSDAEEGASHTWSAPHLVYIEGVVSFQCYLHVTLNKFTKRGLSTAPD